MDKCDSNKIAVIFGGAGFIGSHLAAFLIDEKICSRVILADINRPDFDRFGYFLRDLVLRGKVIHKHCDVRQAASFSELPGVHVDFIFNLAAIHREPGHEPHEYFDTNVGGAENVCAWAHAVGCNNLIFTSSISPYGPTETPKDESALPAPVTPYGESKLAAEKIHLGWQLQDEARRRLVIVRPGVVFGPGEGGNVSRLIRAVLHRYFFYMGNRNTRKAGVYVRELCHALWWVFQRQDESGERVSLFNMSMNPGPSVRDYVENICKVAKVRRWIPSLPYPVLLGVSYLLEWVSRPLGIRHPFSPVRIRKLVRSNNIIPAFLISNGYEFRYTLESAFDDWRKSCPGDWK